MPNSLSTTIPNFNFIDPMTMAAVIYDQAGGTSSTTSNSSTSSTSSTNFRCTDSIPTPSSVSFAAAYAAASANYPSSSLHGNTKSNHLHSSHHLQNGSTNHHHNGQHLYSPNNDYASSPITSTNGYWPYSTQSYFPGTTRQYMVTQPPSSCPITPSGVSDTSSSPSQQDLASYHSHGSYPHMQKMVGNYPTTYEFYQQHNTKYC